MKKIEELKEKLKSLKQEQKFQDDLQRNIQNTENQLQQSVKLREQIIEKEIKFEKDELTKKALFECKPFFKCPKCKKEVEITRTKHIVIKFDARQVVLEGTCPKCVFDVQHVVNQPLKNAVCYSILPDTLSTYKWATRGYF